MTTLLLPEKPISILPQLAVAVGLNEAIFLQQLHYWLLGSKDGQEYGRQKNGYAWIYNDYEGWRAKSFPFWSVSTIRRIVASLEKAKLIITDIEKDSKFPGGRRKWYRINTAAPQLKGSAQNEQGGMFKVNTPSVQNGQSYNIDTETTTETTTNSESPKSGDSVAQPSKAEHDAWFDALAEYVYEVEPRTPAASAEGARIGRLRNWCQGQAVKFGNRAVDGCDLPVTVDDVRQFRAWYRAEHDGANMPRDAKFISHFYTWLNKRHRQQQERAQRPTLTDAEREAIRAQQFAPLPKPAGATS